MKNSYFVNMLAYYTDHSPFGKAIILINMIILGRWKIGIMLVYTAHISIIISLTCVGVHPLLYWGDVTGNTLT